MISATAKASLITVAVSMNCPWKFHPQLTSQKWGDLFRKRGEI